jgi:tRNA dimethylallyltransferase
MELARRFDGEIICADSRTVYRGMDIGTAKPTEREQAEIPHHVLDVIEPDERFTAADFKRLANEAIDSITSRGKLPVMVGGTGLYIDAVIFDYHFSTPEEAALRDPRNPRHLLHPNASDRSGLRPHTLLIGLTLERKVLKRRIEARVEAMVAAGLVDEVRRLTERYHDVPALQAPGYRAFRGYVTGRLSLEEAKTLFIKHDLQLAKRQRTWFKRNNSIHWVENPSKAVEIATTFLNKNG